MAYDLIVKNALIVDGTGKKAYGGDVGVKDGLIAAVGKVEGEAKRVIDAGGLVAAPGFIDAHTHYDGQLLWDPSADPATSHGVTTILMGNCGFTLAPVRPKDQDYLLGVFATTEEVPKSALLRHAPLAWESFPEYMNFVDKSALGVNVMTQVGHTALRRYVMGEDALTREATEAEVTEMVKLAEEAMDVGADGGHVPSYVAADEEMIALAAAVRRKRKPLVSINPRSKRDGISPEDKAFMVTLAEASGTVVSWNDFGARARNWRETLSFMEAENERGNKVCVIARCQPPETRFALDRLSPMYSGQQVWLEYCRLDDAGKIAALGDAGWRERLAEYWYKAGYLKNCVIEKVDNPALKPLENRRLVDIAEERGTGVVETMFDIARDDALKTFFLLASPKISPEDEAALKTILKSPATLVGISDGGAHLQTFSGADYPTYFLKRWVRETDLFTLEDGVAALTSEVATFMGLTDRGTLEVGKAADITIFDPETIAPTDLETLAFPNGGGVRLAKRSVGISHVIVNGVPIVENGAGTGAVPGVLLRA
jgi:N-acyl-D-amino-acid deacylase